ncbi:MAG: ribulokinase [Bacteroidales bacterium]|nr:ribulokinase [Bacteroidales bacterium]
MKNNYVIGIDFGTDSARAILVDAADGREMASCTSFYKRWGKGLYCDSTTDRYRQHPLDYIESLEEVLKGVLAECPDKGAVRAISIDSTGSSPCLADGNLKPLSLYPEYADNPDAMFVLWKDHTSEKYAQKIISLCSSGEFPNYLGHTGNTYSAECFWCKVAQVLNSSEDIRSKAVTVIEECDYIPAILTGCSSPAGLKTSRGVSGEKWLWAEEWGGFPSEEFIEAVDPVLLPLLRNMPDPRHNCDEPAGHLCEEWATKLGLSTDVVIGVGNIDSYSGAVGGGVAYRKMVMNMGTSACYIAVVPTEVMAGRLIDGVFGQVDGMILRGHDGFEVGLSSFGDAFAWLKRLLSWPVEKLLPEDADPALRKKMTDRILPALTAEAEKLPLRPDAPLATDYFNGRRNPVLNSTITASLTRLKIHSSAPELFYAIVESTAFATKAILDHLSSKDVAIDELVAVGGVAQKSPFVMQLMADVVQREISVSATKNAGAMGAAIHGAVAAGLYKDVPSAQAAMCPPVISTFKPTTDKSRLGILLKRYERYLDLARFTEDQQNK